jgi:predicted O-methyltransferase YrrM
LHFGWNNDSFVADVDYLQAVARAAARAKGNALECGSGLTTVLLAALAGNTNTWVLEHSLEWLQNVSSVLRQHGLDGRVQLCHASLISYGDFHWYQFPADLPANFSLVICDGPPAATTRGGRYGLLPVMHQRLRGCTVLMDDTDRQGEQIILERWKKSFALIVRESGPHSILEVGTGMGSHAG